MLIYTNEIEHSMYLAEAIFIIILAFFGTQIPGKDSQEQSCWRERLCKHPIFI